MKRRTTNGGGPPPHGPFVGRRRELAELAEALEADRLVTLTGPPGVGKTRLALQLAEGDGGDAVVVELAPISDAALVPTALAAALGVDEVGGQSMTDAITTRLRTTRGRVVLDNCEHLLGACAALVAELQAACPDLRLLATSREPLGVVGERIWEVPPLAVPDPGQDGLPAALARCESVALFVARGSAVHPGFALNAYVGPDVAEICRRLDGIPLAIELAAARLATLTPAEVAARLSEHTRPVTDGAHVRVTHHQTLQGAIDWSHDLLSSPERALLRRLSTFVGGFDLEAAEAVGRGDPVDRGEVGELLASLVSKSLVVSERASRAPARHRLLETIRSYAADKLDQAGEVAELRTAHARHYLALAERAEPELTGPRQQQWLTRLEADHGNLRASLRWWLGHGESEPALRLSGALVLFWRVRCHFSEGRDLLAAAVATGNGGLPRLRAKALWGQGFLASMAGDVEGALAPLEESIALSSELGDLRGRARALLILGNGRQAQGDETALALLDQSATLARAAGDSWCLAHALGCAGLEYCHRAELEVAQPALQQCVAVAREAGDKQGLRFGLLGLGFVAGRQGNYESADLVLEECVSVAEDLGEEYTRATALLYLAQNSIGRGDYARARTLLDQSLATIRAVHPSELPVHLVQRARVARAEGDSGHARELLLEAVSLARSGAPMPAVAINAMGELEAEAGDRRAARRLLDEALDLSRAADDRRGAAQALYDLAALALAEGDAKRAAVLGNEALQLQYEVGNPSTTLAMIEGVARLAAEVGRHEQASRLLGAVGALRERAGLVALPWEAARAEAAAALVRRSVSDGEFQAWSRAGALLTLKQAVREAARAPNHVQRKANGQMDMTPIQSQIAALVAEGMTNREIADLLFVSPSTVRNHLTRIFSKLGIKRRTELASHLARRERASAGSTSPA